MSLGNPCSECHIDLDPRAADVTDIAVIDEPVQDKPVLPHDNAILAQGVSVLSIP